MQTLFIQVKCELGRSYEVAAAAVETVDEVSEVHSTSGHYDLMLTCYLESNVDIGHFVNNKIHALPGIKDTYTIIGLKAFS